MLEEFREHLLQTSSPRTARAYLSDARQLVAFLEGRPVTLREVEAWIGSMNHGTRRAQTLGRKRAAARRLLGFLAANGDREALEALTILQAYKIVPPIRQVDRREVRAVSRDEFEALCAKASPRYRALFALLWWTGCRVSEALGDPVADIRPLTGADLRHLVERGYAETSGKGGRRRVLLLPPAGRAALRGYLDSRSSDETQPGANGEAVLWTISPQAVNATLHRLGFGGGCHSFRHSFRARLRQAGVSEELQRALMGHGPKDVTSVYGAADVEEMLDAVERLT